MKFPDTTFIKIASAPNKIYIEGEALVYWKKLSKDKQLKIINHFHADAFIIELSSNPENKTVVYHYTYHAESERWRWGAFRD